MGKAATAKKTEGSRISAPSRARARPNDQPVAGEAAAVWVKPSELKPWAKNPRRNDHAVPAVVASIRDFGFGAPIVARTANREIIKGHTRWKAAKELGLELVPVRFLDISERAAHRLARADNKLGELADWDDEEIARQLQELDADEQMLEGWAPDEAGDLIAALNEDDAIEDPDEDDEPLARSKRKTVCPNCKHEW